jgi:hemerythrin superfamily protein
LPGDWNDDGALFVFPALDGLSAISSQENNMSIIDDAVAALTPAPTEEDRMAARDRARSVAQPGDWLSLILDHHVQLEDAFDRTKADASPDGRKAALKQLGGLLTGHAGAEESVIYPAMDMSGETRHADHAYNEQVIVKKQMAALEQLDPMSTEFTEKVEEIRTAVAHHMIEEEGTWFPDLHGASGIDQQMLTKRYSEEFNRYVGGSGDRPATSF